MPKTRSLRAIAGGVVPGGGNCSRSFGDGGNGKPEHAEERAGCRLVTLVLRMASW